MTIAFVQAAALGSTSGGTSQQTVAFAANPTLGNYIVAWSWGLEGATHNQVPAFSDTAGNAYVVPSGGYQHLAGDLWVIIGYARVTATAGSFTVQATAPSATVNATFSVVAVEFSGIVASSPLDGTAVGTAPGTAAQTFAPGNLAPAAGSLVVAAFVSDITGNPVNLTSPSGWASAGKQLDGSSFEAGEGIYQVNPSSPANPTWTTTATANLWAAAQFALLAKPLAIKPPAPKLQTVQQATGLAYFGVMYEGSGTTLHDLSTNVNNGTVGAIWGTGQFSGADLNIAGTKGNVVLLPGTTGFAQPGDFSVSCWVKLTANTSQAFTGYFSGTGSQGWAVGCDDAGSGKVKFYTQNATAGSTFLSSTVLTLGAWHHVAATFTNATGVDRIYIDGVLDATSSAGQNIPAYPAGATHASVGGLTTDGTGTGVFQPTLGEIDAVAVYNYVLPASGGTKDSVAGIFADPFTAVRPIKVAFRSTYNQAVKRSAYY